MQDWTIYHRVNISCNYIFDVWNDACAMLQKAILSSANNVPYRKRKVKSISTEDELVIVVRYASLDDAN
jgi:hypothetical protein